MKLAFPTQFRWDISLFTSPLLFLVFLYFVTLSADLVHTTIGLFTFKINNLFGGLLFLVLGLIYKEIRLSKQFLLIWCYCLAAVFLSMTMSYNLYACIGFLFFFVFNYFIYFVLAGKLFAYFPPETILRLYFLSFFAMGCYAAGQVFGSLLGLHLPFATQRVFFMARGQGMSYEPSYYALYMTPFAIFYTTKYLLSPEGKKRLKDLFWPNFFLLVSTSTGCIFSYIAYFFWCLFALRAVSLKKLIFQFATSLVAGFSIIYLVFPQLITHLFLKFFFKGFMTHGSFAERWDRIVEYWHAFLDQPWFGTGYGGASAYILMHRGREMIDLLSREELASALATNVTMEVLASVGIVGALGFVAFLYAVFRTFRKALQIPSLSEEERHMLLAFAASLAVTFFTLQFNQSIMRGYIWFHAGIGVAYAQYLLKRKR